MHPDLAPVEDSLPRDGLFEQPLVVSSLDPGDPEDLGDGLVRVTFRAVVRDAQGRRCPDLAVEATITGPEREATGTATTDLLGAVRFRMTGPPGRYAVEVVDVAAGALTWDRDRATATVEA